MIKAIGWLIKIGLFSIVVLVLGNWVKWGGRTVSDQVKTQVSHAERSRLASSIKHWTNGTLNATQPTTQRLLSAPPEKKEKRPEANPMERIQSSERQKLRALIQELNSSTSADLRGDR